MNIGNNGSSSFGHADLAFPSHVAAHGLTGCQSGTLTHQKYGGFGTGDFCDVIHSANPAIADKNGIANVVAITFQPLFQGGQDIAQVGGNGR